MGRLHSILNHRSTFTNTMLRDIPRRHSIRDVLETPVVEMADLVNDVFGYLGVAGEGGKWLSVTVAGGMVCDTGWLAEEAHLLRSFTSA